MSRVPGTSFPFPVEIQEWIVSWFVRVTAVLAPVVALLLVYRWKIGVLDAGLASLALVLFPLALLPWAEDRASLRAKAGILLGVFVVSACLTFASSGIEGIGPIISILAAFMAFHFFGNRSFWIVCSVLFVVLWVSALARMNGQVVPSVDFDLPINVFGRALTLTLILGVILAALRGVVLLLVKQTALAAHNNARSEMALSELNLFIESANAPIFGIDNDGRINEWNAQAAFITGYSRGEALGNNLVDSYITDEYKASVSDVLARALAGTNTANYEFPIYSRGGKRVEILLNATTRRDTEGTITGVMGVGQDITLYREQERRLRQAQKMESVGQLTGGIAHDFNNLLTVISANLELAVFEVDNAEEAPPIKELLSDAASAANDGAYLTSQLLSFASLQSFKLDSFNLQALVSDIIRKASATFPSGIKCSVSIEADDITVRVDRVRLESSILNLLSNATAAIEKRGSISVLCQTKQFLNSEEVADYGVPVGEYIAISVSDDGCGISESLLDQVKNPFFTTKGVGEGSGLGLSMVDSFATQLGGRLRIQSTAGVGTTVTILIPLVRGEAGTRIEKTNAQQETSVPQAAKTVLVVEDEARIRQIAVRHLVAGGFRCIEAGDAAQALEVLAAEAEGIDILFSDIRMPGDMTGRDLAAEVARVYPRIKTGLTTGYEQTTRSPEMTMTGTDADTANLPVLRKPYSRKGLIDLLSELGRSEPS
jgi:PAS domain S-box-containing protein